MKRIVEDTTPDGLEKLLGKSPSELQVRQYPQAVAVALILRHSRAGLREERRVVHESPERQQAIQVSGLTVVAKDATEGEVDDWGDNTTYLAHEECYRLWREESHRADPPPKS